MRSPVRKTPEIALHCYYNAAYGNGGINGPLSTSIPSRHHPSRLVKELGILFREIRETKGLTRMQLAIKTKLKTRRIGTIENAKCAPTIGELGKLANALGTPLYRIFARAEARIIGRGAPTAEKRRRKSRRSHTKQA